MTTEVLPAAGSPSEPVPSRLSFTRSLFNFFSFKIFFERVYLPSPSGIRTWVILHIVKSPPALSCSKPFYNQEVTDFQDRSCTISHGVQMYKGYPICLEEDDGTVSVLRLKLEPLEKVRLHEEVLPDMSRKICRAICEERVLQDPIFIDEDSKVILDGMHRAAALLKLKHGECRELFWDEHTQQYTYPACEKCQGKFKNLEYIFCCAVDYTRTKSVTLNKWYRGVLYPFQKAVSLVKDRYRIEPQSEEDAFASLREDSFTILTDGNEYYAVFGDFTNILKKYLAIDEIEQMIRKNDGHIIYCADEEAFKRLKKGEFSFLMITPTITKKDVQTFSVNGIPEKGEVFPPKSTRHRLSARPLKVNIPLRLLEKGDYTLKQEQLKVFLRRKRKLIVTGRLEQYLEKYKILFGEPGELQELGRNPYLWVCEFPLEFYEIKYDVDEFTDDASSLLIQKGMELDYAALIRETNRLVLIISNVKEVIKTEQLLQSLLDTHFPEYTIENLFGKREDDTTVWMVPMEDYTPSRAYFERNERLMRQLVAIHKALTVDTDTFQKTALQEDIKELQTCSSQDLLLLFAFHVLGKTSRCKIFEYIHEDINDYRTVFSRIKALQKKGLIKKTDEYTLTEKGKELIQKALAVTRDVTTRFRELSPRRFSEFLAEIDSNVSHVIKPDGRKDEFHIGSVMESLVFTDMGWKAVADVLDRVAEEFESVDFASSDELTSFIKDYVEEEHPLTNIPFRYDYFINSRNYIFLKDKKVISLSRQYIEQDLNRFIPSFLEMTASQKSQLSNMVYEGIRLLTIPLIKELYERERIVVEKGFFSQIEEFLVFQAVPVLKKLQNKSEKEVSRILMEILDDARTNVELSRELLERNSAEFLKYYLPGMDSLTQGISVGLGRVPFFDVFGRLNQLAGYVKSPSADVVFLSVEDAGRFLRHVNHVFRRSISLLDQWRSVYRKYHEEPFLDQYGSAWRRHLKEVIALVDKSVTAV